MFWFFPCHCLQRHTASPAIRRWLDDSSQRRFVLHREQPSTAANKPVSQHPCILSPEAADYVHLHRTGGFYFAFHYDVGCRSPPLLIFGLSKFQKTEVCRMARQYYRKSRHSDQHSINGWVTMTERGYYQFITDPRNQDCRFIDLGDVVLESPESICREYRAELHHSNYLRKQKAEYNTVLLYCLDEGSGCSGNDVIADEAEAVEEQAIRVLFKRQIREIMPLLTDDQQWLLQELYIKWTNISNYRRDNCIVGWINRWGNGCQVRACLKKRLVCIISTKWR